MGHSHLRECWRDLPEKELIARMGQAGKRLRQLARGELPHLFQPVEPAFTLAERMELDSPVEMLDALLFVVNLLLEQLILRATARVLALAAVTITLKLEGGATHTRTVRPALPTNDRQIWLKLLHLDLEAHPPQAAILAVALEAEPGSTGKVQLGLFSPQLPEPSRLDVTLARIRALVGDENVGRAVLEDTHGRTDSAWSRFALPTQRGADRVAPSVAPGHAAAAPGRDCSYVTLHASGRRHLSFANSATLVERLWSVAYQRRVVESDAVGVRTVGSGGPRGRTAPCFAAAWCAIAARIDVADGGAV